MPLPGSLDRAALTLSQRVHFEVPLNPAYVFGSSFVRGSNKIADLEIESMRLLKKIEHRDSKEAEIVLAKAEQITWIIQIISKGPIDNKIHVSPQTTGLLHAIKQPSQTVMVQHVNLNPTTHDQTVHHRVHQESINWTDQEAVQQLWKRTRRSQVQIWGVN